ncbi:MAG: hypothetical protein J6B49_02905 [Phascolarctobacterium sp.]|nr:hypothetical protein [Phascolarctobacterium sp.]MBQ9763490.1 hypothetical protein [Phascolarctobacterium sp.]
MANHCSNCIAFYGNDLDKLENFRTLMDDKCEFIRDFAMKCGYSEEETFRFTDGRDTFVEVSDVVNRDDTSYYFIIQTESAGTPNVEAFSKILEERYSNQIDFVYCSVEPGSEIYVNTDTNGRFFSDQYHLDFCINGEYVMEYYSIFKEVVEVLREKIPEMEFSNYDSVDEINDRVQNWLIDKPDDYFNLYEYSEE